MGELEESSSPPLAELVPIAGKGFRRFPFLPIAGFNPLAASMDTEPYLDIPSARMAPPAIVRDLRTIDDRAELLYLGPGHWVLGVVKPNWYRAQRAGRILHSARRRPANQPAPKKLRLAEAARQGFRVIAEYHLRDPDSRIVLDFAKRDFLFRFAADMEFEKRLASSAGDPHYREAAKTMMDAAATLGTDVYKWVFRRGRSKGVPVSMPQGVIG